ncbi:sterol desaturase family protein [Dyadobacter psychrophilus]|uniref:Sterol desaturase/sphingolipid hydroxylase, fatty acid hydroxylase superfamily n=1 Tax=Dyadobacter psychrophilus TaxID=651661 RepID=A0A1T5FBU4_9BACT|nr:sterol desaturase family protein [Dyadobacter psychrophilus]SKB93630.1 Sterol desaturase/sphingolipid hydroxylase, fatty acid hydroxylase superfamily [Dyadobacter psychrophilus]
MPGTYEFEDFLLKVSTPFYLLLICVEIFLTYRPSHDHHSPRASYNFKDSFTNALLMLLNGGIDLLFRTAYVGVLIWFYNMGLKTAITNPFFYWFSLFLFEDLAFYTLHYVDHHSRLFWAVHVTHHSSEHFNLTTGFRSSVFQPLYRFVYFIPVALVGFNPADIIIMYSLTQIYGIIVHTEYVGKLGWLEYIFVTPSHHRVHHASNVQYLDKNMGMCLIIWDRIFGTFQEELETVPPVYGLTKPIENATLANTVLHEWKEIGKDFKQKANLRTKLNYLIKAPGWSHDGSRQTTKDLQNNLSRNNGSETQSPKAEII